MMEEPELELQWEIQEYLSFKGSHENTMMKWILNKGYGIGKKMVITGIAISAVPLVLPPIVVFSAMGVAFSIPSGFVFATYACTNKLMTTLLPTPPSPVILEYFIDEDEDEKAKNEGVECRLELNDSSNNGYRQMDELEKGYYLNEYGNDLGPENVMQEEDGEEIRVIDPEMEALVSHAGWDVNEYEEEKQKDVGLLQMRTVNEDEDRRQMEDTKQGVEMSLGLDVGSNTNFGDSVDEQGYEVDIREYLEGDDDSLREEHQGGKSLLESRLETREENDDSLQKEHKREGSLLESRLEENQNLTPVITEDNKEEIVEESTRILEKLMDEGRVDDDTTEDDYFLNESVSNVVYEAVKEVETTEPITVIEGSVEDNTTVEDYILDGSASNVVFEEIKDVETAEPVTVNEGSIEDNTIEEYYCASNVVLEEVEDAETTEPVIDREIETQKLVTGGIKNNTPIGEMHHVVILSPGNKGNNFNSREVEELDLVAIEVVGDIDQDGGNIDSDEKVMRASMDTQEETGSDIRDEGADDITLRTRKDHLIQENMDARKIDETGLDLFDDQNTSMNFEGLEAGGDVKGTVDENVGVLELPAFRRVPSDTDNAEVTSKTNTNTSSREDALNDKMIWEKIEEKRAIEHNREESFINNRLEENKGKELLLESRLGEDKSKIREVTKDSLEDIVKGSTGLLQNVRDKGTANDNTVEDDYFSVSNVVFEEVKDADTTEPVTVREVETQIPVKGGSKNNESIGEMHHIEILSAGNEQNYYNLREVEELDLVSRQVVGDFDKDGGNIDYDEKVMRKSMGTHEKFGSGISDQGTKDASLRTKEDHLIHANADAREMGDESGLDLFDDQKTSMKFQSHKGGGASKEIVDENVDVLALPAFRRVSLDTDNGTVTSKTNAKMPSKEDILDDENIWEKIVAMKTIVGYNAPSQPTCMGELKALYVFTGVEPPTSFEGDTDLYEVNAKLKFLMAVVGVR